MAITISRRPSSDSTDNTGLGSAARVLSKRSITTRWPVVSFGGNKNTEVRTDALRSNTRRRSVPCRIPERTRLIGVPSRGNAVRLALNRLCDKSTTNRSGLSSDSVLNSAASERSSTTRVWSGARHSRTASTSAAQAVDTDTITDAIATHVMSTARVARGGTDARISLAACFLFKGISIEQRFK